jgi:hypothetical protein
MHGTVLALHEEKAIEINAGAVDVDGTAVVGVTNGEEGVGGCQLI